MTVMRSVSGLIARFANFGHVGCDDYVVRSSNICTFV